MNYREKLGNFLKDMESSSENSLGYPLGATLEDTTELCEFLSFTLNNLGDPFGDTNYKTNTFAFEKEIVEYFASLYNCRPFWGYVTSGGSEGNLYGINRALKRYPNAIVYFTRATHYSVKKACELTRAKYQYLPMDDHDEIVPKAAIKVIDPNTPAIIVLNYGSTMTGGIDNIGYMSDMLFKLGLEHYVHVDAALAGSLTPFISHKPNTTIDFGRYNIDSVSLSGHKFWQAPIPCGVVLQKGLAERKSDVGAVGSKLDLLEKQDQEEKGQYIRSILVKAGIVNKNGDIFSEDVLHEGYMNNYLNKDYYTVERPKEEIVEYVGCKDSTILGSRSGLAALAFWYRIQQYEEEGLESIAEDCVDKARYLIENIDGAWRTGPWSNTVVFKRPPAYLCEQYQLASQEDISHIVCMPATKWEILDKFITDYNKEMFGV